MDKPISQPDNKLLQLFLSNRDALVCLFDQGIVSVAGFATSVLIGRLAPSELGVYYIGLALVLFARGFQQQLVSTPYTIYQHRQTPDGIAAYRGSCLVQECGFLIIAVIYLLLQIAAAWAGWVSPEVVPSLFVLLMFMPVILIREVARHYCFTHSKNASVLGIDVGISVIQIGVLLLFGYLGILSGATAWIATGLACLLALGYWYVHSGPSIDFQTQRVADDLKLNWTFGKWAVSGQFVGSLPTYLLPWLLLTTAGTEGTGYFAACITLVGVANIFNTGMLNFLTPRAASVYVNDGNQGLRRLMIQMYGIFLFAVGGFAVFLSVFGGSVAVKIFGDHYAGLQVTLTLLAVAKLFEGFSHTASGGLFAMEKIKANFYVDVILMLVTITAAVLLIFPYGVVGAAWTTLIGSAVSAVLRSGLVFKFLSANPTAGGSNV